MYSRWRRSYTRDSRWQAYGQGYCRTERVVCTFRGQVQSADLAVLG